MAIENADRRDRVVIVGAGFGGLEAAKALSGAAYRVTVIDRRNYHLFQPLLYQVATAALSPADIAAPIRGILRHAKNCSVLLSTVTGVDTANRTVMTDRGVVPYDHLVLATGARHAYFGHDEWEPFAPGLKKIEDATEVRRRILLAFERAETESSLEERTCLLTFIVVGGGPTGVEMAGAIAELARNALAADFRNIDPRDARIVLVEAGPRLLPAFDPRLSEYARKALTDLGVEVILGEAVTDAGPAGAIVGDRRIEARTMMWAAGVRASPAGKWLGVETDRAGRIPVNPDLSLPGHPEIFVLGDAALLKDEAGRPLPGVATVAQQQGKYLAKLLEDPRAWQEPAALPLPRSRPDGDYRAQPRDRRNRQPALHRVHRLGAVVLHPHLRPDRFPQPVRRRAFLVLELSHLRTRHAPDHRSRQHRRDAFRAAGASRPWVP